MPKVDTKKCHHCGKYSHYRQFYHLPSPWYDEACVPCFSDPESAFNKEETWKAGPGAAYPERVWRRWDEALKAWINVQRPVPAQGVN